ncbi:alpha/beta fold hydrolase, partial [Caballeronia udeis]|uniref:alpha/beta fold hydrolase n=1 Tax=Caballeronia udeis TaxID=1232866 RepID=UPI000AEA7242
LRSSLLLDAGSLLPNDRLHKTNYTLDFTADLKKITVPTLVMHGDDDQIVPYADSGPLSAKLLQNGTLKTYKGFPHGMPTTQADTINADLLAFINS